MKRSNAILLVVLLAALGTYFSISSKHFLSLENLMSITEHMAEFGIMSMGMMLTILVSGIDLTVSSVCGLTSIIIITVMKSGAPMPIAILVGLCAALLMGTFTGIFVAKLGVPPMLLTLAMSMLFTGISYVICEGNALSGFPESYFFLGQGEILGIPVQTLLFAIIVLVMFIVLRFTPWGLQIYAIGNNPKAARYSGTAVMKVTMSAYIISGLLSGIAGVVMSSRVASARLDLGSSYQTNCIAAAVLGGTSIAGGEGSPIGTLLGVTILSMLSNGLNHVGVSSFIQQLIIGVTLVAVVVINSNILPVLSRKNATG